MIHAKDLVEVLNQTQPRSHVHLLHEPTGLEAQCNFFKDHSKNKAVCTAMLEAGICILDKKSNEKQDSKQYYGY